MTDQTSTVPTDAGKGEKRQIAQHILLGSDGAVVEDIEDAHGIRYVDIASGGTVDFVPKNPNAIRMAACFGLRTLATNVASATRQKDGTSQDEIDAIRERFDYMEAGHGWMDRTREVGARWDVDVLAQAAVNVVVAKGLIPANDAPAQAAALAKFRDKMNADKAQVTAIRQVEGVEAEYRKLQGKTAKSADDLAAMLSA